MKKVCQVCGVLCVVFSLSQPAGAQSLKNLLNSSTVKNAVTSVTGGQGLTVKNLNGTWTYVNPAVQLESDNALTNIAGNLASEELEKKLKEVCAKAGIVENMFNYTFNSDSTFTSVIKGKTLNGTYAVDPENKTIELHYGKYGNYKLATMKAKSVISGDQLSLLFEADKLLDFLSKVASLSNNSTLQMVSQLAGQYDGMLIGFDLKK